MAAAVAALVARTDEVQRAMDAGDWRLAAELERERRAALEALLLEQQVGAAGIRPALEALLESTYRLLGQAHHHRRRLLREAATIRTGQQAAASYTGAQQAAE